MPGHEFDGSLLPGRIYRILGGTMGTWLMDNKDLIGIGLAFTGLIVTAYTVMIARATKRREAFMRIHEALLQPEIQEGRRLLFQIHSRDDVPRSDSTSYQMINRSLAMYDTLGHYVRRGHVDRRQALDAWHHSLRDAAGPAAIFIQVRESAHRSAWLPWPWLRWLVDEAAAYRSKEGCCVDAAAARQVSPESFNLPGQASLVGDDQIPF